MLEAVKVALDPTPRQERLLESHAGAARFAYNNGLAHVKDMLERGDTPEWSYYALRRWWNQAKNTLAMDETTGELCFVKFLWAVSAFLLVRLSGCF